MSAKQQLAITFFNETVLQFIEDLLTIYRKDPLLIVAQTGIKLYLRNHVPGLHKAFLNCFSPYFDQIKARDESFFLTHTTAEYKADYKRLKAEADLAKDIDELRQQYKDNIPETEPVKRKSVFDSVITKLKNEWTQMSVTNKDVIWEYVNQLVMLSERVGV